MKKKVFLVCVLSLIFILPFIFAADNDTETSDSSKINKAYTCLRDAIEEKDCDNLGVEEQIFSLLAVGKCKNELLDSGDSKECWPEDDCSIKTTAQAIIALKKAGTDTDDAEDWLLDHETTPSDLTWYLQIQSTEETTCTIDSDGGTYEVLINKDKQISSNAGSCLTLSEGKWWLKIAPSCYDEEFEISCDKKFLTNLLFKKEGSATIHVSETTTESSANGLNTEKVNSLCFGESTTCDFEGSLWASITLDYLGENVSAYLPYLITMSEDDDNDKYLSESFLYYLTNSYDFRNSLLLKQKANRYWDESGDRLYDTALALLPFEDEPQEKTNAKQWLLETQDENGCWQGSIMGTGFILYSVWGSSSSSGDSITESADCEESGGYCMGSIACSELSGNELNFLCPGMSVCCSKEKTLDSCFDQGGEFCSSEENCVGGITVDASDSESGETCSVSGKCVLPAQESECVAAGGTCRTASCSDGEKELSQSCDYSSDLCCVQDTSSSKMYIWILLFGILILIAIIAILYRDKIRAYWYSFKSKGKSSPAPSSRTTPFFPPSTSAYPRRGVPPRRLIPTNGNSQRKPFSRPEGEMEDVLKKLKEMGK